MCLRGTAKVARGIECDVSYIAAYEITFRLGRGKAAGGRHEKNARAWGQKFLVAVLVFFERILR